MHQPDPPGAIEELRDFLSFAVPLRAADLSYKIKNWGYSRDQAVNWLTGEAERAGLVLGAHGDVLQFSDGRPRVGRVRDRVAVTAGELANGVAAVALIAQLDGRPGVTVFGDVYGNADPPHRATKVPGQRALPEGPQSVPHEAGTA